MAFLDGENVMKHPSEVIPDACPNTLRLYLLLYMSNIKNKDGEVAEQVPCELWRSGTNLSINNLYKKKKSRRDVPNFLSFRVHPARLSVRQRRSYCSQPPTMK